MNVSRNGWVIEMDEKKLKHFTKKLLTEYDRIRSELGDLESGIVGLNSPSVAEYEEKSTMEEQKEYLSGLLNHNADELKEIQVALQKILNGTYGICERCGKQIEESRLEVIPTSRYCKKCAEEMEKEKMNL